MKNIFKIVILLFNINFIYCQYGWYDWNVYKYDVSNYIGKFGIIDYHLKINYNSTIIFPEMTNLKDIWFHDNKNPYYLRIYQDSTNKYLCAFYYNNEGCGYIFDMDTKYHGHGKIEGGICPESCDRDDCNNWNPPKNFFNMNS